MNLGGLEEARFFYVLHGIEFERGMAAARNCNTREWRECSDRMKVLSLRLKKALEGHYQRAKVK